MLGLPSISENLSKVDLEGYPRRVENGVAALSRACRLDVGSELARFRTCRDRLGVPQKQGPAGDWMTQVRQSVLSGTPLIFELVATFAGDSLKGFGYLTQGRSTGTLPANLGGLLAGTLELHLGGGGSQGEALLLADVFRLVFPSLGGLVEFSLMSQGMIVGIVPRGGKLTLKTYFNTRLDSSGEHRAKVVAILARCGMQDQGFYDLLYAQNDGVRFHGVGIDLDGDGCNRVKLYVRMPRARLNFALETLAARLQPDTTLAESTILKPVREMLEAMRSDELVDEVELAAALRTGGTPTAKVTVFWASSFVSVREHDQLKQYLSRLGYPADALDNAIAALADNADRAVSQRHPLHGLGIEVPTQARPKLNVYLQPVL